MKHLSNYVVDENGCWIFTGPINKTNGYGIISIKGAAQRTTIGAHRMFYEHHVGPIAEGLEIDHLCSVRACVNPEHLEPVTHAENVRRAAALITHCRHGHPFSGDNLIVKADGRRLCRACRRAIAHQSYLRRKVAS